MFELIALVGVGAASVWGYVKSRSFVRDRLRYVDAAKRPSAPIIAGTVAALAAGPVVVILPFVGIPSAIVFGLAVGAGVAHGARDVKRLPGA
jgi:hypothetical protein